MRQNIRVSTIKQPHIVRASFFLFLLVAIALTGCSGQGGVGAILGIDRARTPDEFAVVKRAPLTLPPSFDLRPPDPNGQRVHDLQARYTAAQTIFGQNAGGDVNSASATAVNGQIAQSEGEMALLQNTGAVSADPSIRQQIQEENASLANLDEGFLKSLIFWKKQGAPAPQLVDPVAESRRLQENAALGQEITTGMTPTIRRDSEKAFFDWF